jgi:hypothetical protein
MLEKIGQREDLCHVRVMDSPRILSRPLPHYSREVLRNLVNSLGAIK